MAMFHSKQVGYEFARTFAEDVNRAEKAKQAKTENALKQSLVMERAIEKAESDAKQSQELKLSYDKWEAIEQKVKFDEKIEAEKAQEEAAMMKNAAAMGCFHDHTKERDLYEKSTEDKLNAADRFRLEGNAAYQIGNHGLAAVNYRKSLLQFDYCFPESPNELLRFDTIKLSCHLNLAACKLHQQEWDEVLTQCRQALAIDPQNCKAYYRRGVTYLKLDDFANAREALDKARSVEPHNQQLNDAIKCLNTKIRKYQERNRKVYPGMLAEDDLGDQSKHQIPFEYNGNTGVIVSNDDTCGNKEGEYLEKDELNTVAEVKSKESEAVDDFEIQGGSHQENQMVLTNLSKENNYECQVATAKFECDNNVPETIIDWKQATDECIDSKVVEASYSESEEAIENGTSNGSYSGPHHIVHQTSSNETDTPVKAKEGIVVSSNCLVYDRTSVSQGSYDILKKDIFERRNSIAGSIGNSDTDYNIKSKRSGCTTENAYQITTSKRWVILPLIGAATPLILSIILGLVLFRQNGGTSTNIDRHTWYGLWHLAIDMIMKVLLWLYHFPSSIGNVIVSKMSSLPTLEVLLIISFVSASAGAVIGAAVVLKATSPTRKSSLVRRWSSLGASNLNHRQNPVNSCEG